MAFRSDVSVLWFLSPRIILIDAPSVEITIQDLHDTLRDIEDEPANMVYPSLIETAGKENLGGGVKVGLTATLQNAYIAFGARTTPLTAGTATLADPDGIILTDGYTDFDAYGVFPGSTIFNTRTADIATVIDNISGTELRHFELSGGTDGYWNNGDPYLIYPNIQCSVSGGNLVAVDDLGSDISPVLATANVQIKLTSSSSATLQSQLQLEHSTFNGGVTIDVINGVSGTGYPIGTEQQPVSNTSDAISIADYRGFSTFFVTGNLTVDSGLDYTNRVFIGSSKTKSTITITPAAIVLNSEFSDCTVAGTLDGGSKLENCQVVDLNFVDGFIENCILSGTIILSGTGTAHFLNCFSGIPGSSTPTIDMGVSGSPLAIRGYNGGIKLTNHAGTDAVSLDMSSGQVVIDSTITNGTILVRGLTKLTDNSTGDAIVDSSDAIVPSRLTNIQFLIEVLRPHHTGFGNIYYWDPISGSDTFDGLSPTRARITLQSINDDLLMDNNHDIVICVPSKDGYNTIVDQTVVLDKAYSFIRGPGRDFIMRPATDPGTSTIEISAEGVEVSGLRVDGYATSATPKYVIHSTGDFTLLNNLWVSSGSKGGVELSGSSNSIIDSCTLTNNATYGIDIHNGGIGSSIKNCVIFDNTFDGIRVYADNIGDTVATIIDGDNIIHGNGEYGIHIESNADQTNIGANISMWYNVLGNILDEGLNTGYSGDLERLFTADAIWEEPLIDHTDVTTFGGANQGTSTVDAYQIADAVWSLPVANYFDNIGSFGKVLGFTLAQEATVTSGTVGAINTTLTDANNFWASHQVIIYDQSTGKRVIRSVSTYLQANGSITFNEDLPFTPANGDLVILISRSSSATATATVDVDAIADAVWEEPKADHTDPDTFGDLQNGATDGYSPTPDPPTNTNIVVDRKNFANSMISGAGPGSIRFVSQTRRLTISVQKQNIGVSVDGGANYLVLPIGTHILSIGWIKQLFINGSGTWEIIASFS